MIIHDIRGNATILQFDESMLAVSSSTVSMGGIVEVDFVINYTLGEDEWIEFADMKNFCKNLAWDFGCDPERTIVLLTAVPQEYGAWSDDGSCFMTVGLGNAVSLFPKNVFDEKEKEACEYVPGTINSVHIVPYTLPHPALVDTFAIAKLAIAEAMAEQGIKDINGRPCVGTPTDCAVVLCPADLHGKPISNFGWLKSKAGKAVAASAKSAFAKAYRHKYPDGSIYPSA